MQLGCPKRANSGHHAWHPCQQKTPGHCPEALYRNGAADDQAVAGRRRMDCVQAIQNGFQASIVG
jgi:hypothetical protein